MHPPYYSRLRAVLDLLDDNDLLTVRTVRRLLAEAATHEAGWLKLAEAYAALRSAEPKLTDRTLRNRCARWERIQARGQTPPIRVRKAGDKPGSPWELHGGDVWGYVQRMQAAGAPVPAGGENTEVDPDAATVAYWVQKVTAGSRPQPGVGA